ncbi:MAG: hypothetical protein LGB62_08475, partial [Sulfurovum sp.]|nr:hypothetical protein [Sulfurovum sp.]
PLILMGCEMPSSQHLDIIRAEMLFTNFFVVHNIALSAADHDICSGAHFCKSELRKKNMCIYDLVPKGVQEKRTEVLENKVDRM